MATEREVRMTLNLRPVGADKVREAFKGIADDAIRAETARQKLLSPVANNAGPLGPIQMRRSAGMFPGGIPTVTPAAPPVEVTTPTVPEFGSNTQSGERNTPFTDPAGFNGLGAELEKARTSLSEAAEDAERVPSTLERWREATKGINDDLESQQRHLDKINAAMDPQHLEKRAAMQLKLEAAQKKYADVLVAERKRQGGDQEDGGGGLLATLGKMFGGGGGILGRVFGGVSKVAGAVGQAGGGAAGGGGGALASIFGGGGAAGGAAAGGAAAGGAAAGGGGAVGGILGAGGGALAIAGPIGAAIAGITMVGSALKDMTEKMIGLAAAANPAQYERFQLAVDDTTAVFGRVFVPILELATDVVRAFGDFLANILPTSDETKEALSPLAEAFEEIKSAAMEVAPFIRDYLTVALKQFALAVKVVATQIKFAIEVFKHSPLGLLMRAYSSVAAPADKTSMGASSQPARYLAVEDIGRQAALAAYAMGTAGEKHEKTAEEKTAEFAEKIFNAIDGWIKTGGKAKEAAGGFIEGAVNGGGWGGLGGRFLNGILGGFKPF